MRDQCSDAQSALGRVLDLVEAEVLHVDQMSRRFHFQLHQVEKISATGDELGAGPASNGAGGRHWIVGALVGEGLHAVSPATSAIASAMLE